MEAYCQEHPKEPSGLKHAEPAHDDLVAATKDRDCTREFGGIHVSGEVGM